MARRHGEVRPSWAADKLGIHICTIYEWCQRAVSKEPSPLRGAVRRDVTRHYWIQRERIAEMLARH